MILLLGSSKNSPLLSLRPISDKNSAARLPSCLWFFHIHIFDDSLFVNKFSLNFPRVSGSSFLLESWLIPHGILKSTLLRIYHDCPILKRRKEVGFSSLLKITHLANRVARIRRLEVQLLRSCS